MNSVNIYISESIDIKNGFLEEIWKRVSDVTPLNQSDIYCVNDIELDHLNPPMY